MVFGQLFWGGLNAETGISSTGVVPERQGALQRSYNDSVRLVKV